MLNEVRLIGNLGADPEIRSTSGGKSVATMSIATNRRVLVGDEWKDEVEWHRVVVWEKQAEACHRYLRKGKLVQVSGRLRTRRWTDAQDVERYSTEIVAESVLFLSPRGDQPSNGHRASGVASVDAAPGSGGDEDIPF